jgi:uncharacterized cupin superfamily protein/GNAT superfamily N-acetyltransferase
MKIVKVNDLNYEQLSSTNGAEPFALSSVVSELLGTSQLFIHHDIIKPGKRSSGAHQHTVIDEVVFVAKGTATATLGVENFSLNEGSFVCFEAKDQAPHYIANNTDQDLETLTFSINTRFDKVIYDVQISNDLVYPEFDFDEQLWERPKVKDDWNQFVVLQKEKLKTASALSDKLTYYESLGVANRILLNLEEAEHFLKNALAITYKHPNQSKLVQNMIRLAHVYQWRKSFEKAALLFEQAWLVLIDLKSDDSLIASYHQHLGKFYFDQGYLLNALAEFEGALKIRQKTNAPQDQIKSSEISINRIYSLLREKSGNVTVRKAQLSDAESIHIAHMKSIKEVCSKDHSKEEIAVWGHRTFYKDHRESAIKNDFVLVAECMAKTEGYGHFRVFEKDGIRRAHVFGLYLTPAILNQHIGKRMIETMIEHCRYQKVKIITLESTLTANAFYKKSGFSEDGPEMTIQISGQPIRCYPMKMVLESK